VEILPQYGVILRPPSSPEYAEAIADIEQRRADPKPEAMPRLVQTEDDPSLPAMILWNRSQTGIASVSWVWKWKPETGRSGGASLSSVGVPSLLAPFGIEERVRKLYGYWHVILPGSKRGIRGYTMFGDNTDVRPPQPDELWTGGITGSAGRSRRSPGPLKWASLTLDGVFFVDGGFAGPDTLHSFDRLTAAVDAYLQVGKIARDGHNQGLSAAEIFARIETLTGPFQASAGPPPQPSGSGGAGFKPDTLRNIASFIGMNRQAGRGDDRIVYALMAWAETPLPNFRKLR
jgi:hypothetical protein